MSADVAFKQYVRFVLHAATAVGRLHDHSDRESLSLEDTWQPLLTAKSAHSSLERIRVVCCTPGAAVLTI